MKTTEIQNTFDTSSILNLISRIHSDVADYLQTKLKDLGLEKMASSHGNILYRLTLEEKLTMSDLAKLVNRDKSTVTVLVRKLEEKGFIKREISEEDGRVSYISLTEEGKSFTQDTSGISKELKEIGYKGFSEEEKNMLLSFLLRISENFSNELSENSQKN